MFGWEKEGFSGIEMALTFVEHIWEVFREPSSRFGTFVWNEEKKMMNKSLLPQYFLASDANFIVKRILNKVLQQN